MSADVHHSPLPPYNAPSGLYSRRSLPILITFIVVVSLLVGFFGIYLCHYVIELFGWMFPTRRGSADPEGVAGDSPGASRRGLDSGLIAAFPTFAYAKDDAQRARNGRECAVCLGEFSHGDVLRLITGCYHVFHQDCIDLWLDHHTTCPVCRLQLDPAAKSPEYTSSPPDSDGRSEPTSAASAQPASAASGGHVVLEVVERPSAERPSVDSTGGEFPVPGPVPEPVAEPEEVFLGRNCVTAAQFSGDSDRPPKQEAVMIKMNQTEHLPCSSIAVNPASA